MKKSRGLLLLLLLLCGTACDLFTTRTPEEPENRQSNWVPPLNPGQVVLNMQNSVYERNSENYVRCLVDSAYSSSVYVFEPDPEVAAEYRAVFDTWSLEREEAVIRQVFSLIPQDADCYLVFSDEKWEVYGSENAVYEARYHLEMHHSQAGIDSVYQGLVTYYLAPDNRGEWSVNRWVDNRISGAESWSRLKAVFGG